MIGELPLDDKIEDVAQQVHDENATADQFAVAQTPFHTHNNADSPQVSFTNLINRTETLHIIIPGTSAATAANYGVFFIAPYNCSFLGAMEVHTTKGTDAGTVSLQVEKLTGITASGSGVSLLTAGFNLKGANNTVQTGALASIAKVNFALKKGDRMGLVLTGTPTSLDQVVVIVQLQY